MSLRINKYSYFIIYYILYNEDSFVESAIVKQGKSIFQCFAIILHKKSINMF